MNNLTIKVGITDGKLDPCLLNSETKREWLDRLKILFGIDPDDLALSILIVLTRACSKPEAVTINAMLAQVIAGQPRDVQETILLAQMASTAQRIQDAIASEAAALLPETKQGYAIIAERYGRLFTQQLTTLRRCRDKHSTQQYQRWIQGSLI